MRAERDLSWSAARAPRKAKRERPHELEQDATLADRVLRLQRTHGNQFVQRLVTHLPRPRPDRRLQRFGAREHVELGNDAARPLHSRAPTAPLLEGVTLDDGSPLSYGEMVALAGDHFGSIDEVRDLLKTPAGQMKIRYARAWKLKIGSDAGIDDATKKWVEDRYFELAANNFSHFSAGGTGQDEYERVHVEALTLAFRAGALNDDKAWSDARMTEAFSNHYLTDLFAGGHVRTPRQEMKEWYEAMYPDSIERFVAYIAERMTSLLESYGDLEVFSVGPISVEMRPWVVRREMRGKIRDLGGKALESFSLGDIVGLAYHNQDNKGLGVVSDVDENGKEEAGGHYWWDVGDGNLKNSQKTRRMAVASVRASLEDLDQMRAAGAAARKASGYVPWSGLFARLDPKFGEALSKISPFRSKRFVPHEATGANTGNVQMSWHWGRLDPVLRASLDETVADDIAGELRGKAASVGDKNGIIRKAGMVLRARRALEEFCDELAAQKTAALETAMDMPASGVEDSIGEPVDAGVPIPAGVPEPEGGWPDAGYPVGAGSY